MTPVSDRRFQSGREIFEEMIPGYKESVSGDQEVPCEDDFTKSAAEVGVMLLQEFESKLSKINLS